MDRSGWNWSFLGVIMLVLAVGVTTAVAGWPRTTNRSLDLSRNGVHGVYNLRNKKGELLLYNFRAVEPGVLYRGSGFPRNRRGKLGEKVGKHPAAYFDRQVFDFFRSKNIRRIITLQEQGNFYGELGYFDYWSRKTGFHIDVQAIPIKNGHAYDRDARPLIKYPMKERWFGLSAAAEFIRIMQKYDKRDGAVYIHCDAGKDRTGVVAAAYELWRNQNHPDPEALWKQVRERYLVSNVVIARDPEAARFAGGKVSPDNQVLSRDFVRPEWIEKLRPDLERIAHL